MKYSEFLKAVQARQIQPVVTFLGPEKFLKDRAMEAVVKRFLDEDSRAYNFRALAAEELKDSSFLDDASTLPMFGEWKIVVIRDASALEKSYVKIKDYLERYLDSPSPSTILIFDVDSWEGRSKLKPLLTKKTSVVEFQSLSEREIPSWIVSHLRTFQYQIDAAAVAGMVDRIGPNLLKISAELEKLMLLRGHEKKIRL